MNRFIRLCFVLIVASLSVFSQDEYVSGNRLALLIGNGDYSIGQLANPVNDVRAMKLALEEKGFDVLKYEDLDQRQMKMAIDLFGNQLRNYDVGLFFYAGHGIQVKGFNYLIPVDATLSSEQQVEYDCVQVDRVLAMMEAGETDVNIIILDACRNNPFERSWSRSANSKGLAFMNAPQGTLIAYATAPGSTASDGSGNNGLYTEAILESINIPDASIIQMFQNVRSIVSEKSKKKQIPWESTSLIGDFYFGKEYNLPEKPKEVFNQNTITSPPPEQKMITKHSNVLEENPGLFNDLEVAPKKFFTGANRFPIIRIQDESNNEVFQKNYSDQFFIYKQAFLASHLTFDGKKVKKNQIQSIMSDNKDALSMYNRAVNVKRTHQILFFGGFGLFLIDNSDGQINTGGVIGAGMTLCSLIPMIVSTKMFNESFEIFHKSIVKESIIQANPNGIGLKIVF